MFLYQPTNSFTRRPTRIRSGPSGHGGAVITFFQKGSNSLFFSKNFTILSLLARYQRDIFMEYYSSFQWNAFVSKNLQKNPFVASIQRDWY
jgi:hypothetical protein